MSMRLIYAISVLNDVWLLGMVKWLFGLNGLGGEFLASRI